LPQKPEKILTDNGPQFREEWKHWCAKHHIEPLFAHPYYPQNKGKIERAIRNLNGEFIYQLKKFPQWLNGQLTTYQRWYNTERFHRGIQALPASLYRG
jgi:transposase InsO family protein